MSPNEPIDKQLMEFFHRGRQQKFGKGEIIMRAGDVPQGIYFIDNGHVKVYFLTKQGNEHTHMIYKPGDIFPMIYAFKDAIRNVFYEALDDCTVYLVPKDNFKEFAGSNAQVSVGLLEQAVDMFRLYAGRIDNLLYSNSHERTAYRLLSIIDRMGEQKADGSWVVDVPITHQDIASSVNLSRETVSRCMERLRRKGIIGPNINSQLTVLDLPGLANVIGADEVIGMWPNYTKFLKVK